ncbi:MAG: hypothetical protein FH749_11355 [Firmicutes bacterium]|nr:hypothetical protein [Bacillota bacterium]
MTVHGVRAEICWNDLRTRIFALAIKLTGNRFEADDLTQEAVLKVRAKIDDFRGESQFF